MTIFFIGYIEAGKRKWGKKLAKELNYKFLDTKQLMQEKTGNTYAELLQNKELFIETEQVIVDEISVMGNTVIATSELLPCRGENIDKLNNAGLTIYLRAGVGCIMMKLGKTKDRSPMLKNIDPDFIPDFINMELNRRKPFYLKAKINVLARELNISKLLEIVSNNI